MSNSQERYSTALLSSEKKSLYSVAVIKGTATLLAYGFIVVDRCHVMIVTHRKERCVLVLGCCKFPFQLASYLS